MLCVDVALCYFVYSQDIGARNSDQRTPMHCAAPSPSTFL